MEAVRVAGDTGSTGRLASGAGKGPGRIAGFAEGRAHQSSQCWPAVRTPTLDHRPQVMLPSCHPVAARGEDSFWPKEPTVSSMTRRVFYSFHYADDAWRASQVRNMGVVEGNRPATDNDWESVKAGGDRAIKAWIDRQLHRRSCAVVLVGSSTAGRKWINYEIDKAWRDGKGVVGIHIHGLQDQRGRTSPKGQNPFETFSIGGQAMSSIVECYDPPGRHSNARHDWISTYLARMIENAINIRNSYGAYR